MLDSHQQSGPQNDDPMNEAKIDEAVLALLYLGLHDGVRAWKSFDWGATDRLHRKGLISNPATRAKSVVFTEVGLQEAEDAYRRLFETGD